MVLIGVICCFYTRFPSREFWSHRAGPASRIGVKKFNFPHPPLAFVAALSFAVRAELKKITRDLLAKIKKLLVLNWRQKPSARSKLQLAIQDTLDESLPPAFTQDLHD